MLKESARFDMKNYLEIALCTVARDPINARTLLVIYKLSFFERRFELKKIAIQRFAFNELALRSEMSCCVRYK